MIQRRLTICRALQRQRHEIQKQWAEAHQRRVEVQQRDLQELKTTMCMMTDAVEYQMSSRRIFHSNSEVTQEDATFQSETQSCEQLEKRYRVLNKVSNRQKKYTARFQTPWWLSIQSYAWEVCG